MPVPSSIADLSTSASSNSPSGSESIGTSLDDYMRTIQAIIKQQDSKGSDITAASAITIPAVGNYFVVTGNTTINSIVDSWVGRTVVMKFSGTPQLTNSAGLVLINGANIAISAGDTVILNNESTGVWKCVVHQPYAGNQPYDADTAKLDVAQSWPSSQKSGDVTDNDGSFDLSGAGNNYTSTPTSAVAITFTNIAANASKSGYLTLINGSNYAFTAHANTKIVATDLTKIGASGTYVLPYLCDGTDVNILGAWKKP